MVTDKMNYAGNRMACDMMNVSLLVISGTTLDEWFNENPNTEDKDLLIQYKNGDIDSVTAIYLAMERAK